MGERRDADEGGKDKNDGRGGNGVWTIGYVRNTCIWMHPGAHGGGRDSYSRLQSQSDCPSIIIQSRTSIVNYFVRVSLADLQRRDRKFAIEWGSRKKEEY